MDAGTTDAASLEGRHLTTWTVLPGGRQIRLGFVAADGKPHGLILSVDVLSGLLMTLPRMLQSALDAQFPDRSLRMVQRLAAWRLEAAENNADVILQLATADGFEVAFALNRNDADALGAALVAVPTDDNRSLMRKPN